MMMRPALMSAPMVLATLADYKEVTRRLKGLEDQNRDPGAFSFDYMMDNNTFIFLREGSGSVWPARCPYGVAGDGLWVRENFRLESIYDHVAPSVAPSDRRVWFEADGKKPEWAGRLRPSIHMPRWLSRIDLEVGKVFPQRLVDLTESDAQREGVQKAYGVRGINSVLNQLEEPGTYRAGFWQLWDKINPTMLFERNPWVWVVNFKRLTTHQ